jgi:uncharacterized protein
LVKVVKDEDESTAIRVFVFRARLVTSEVAVTEVSRVLRRGDRSRSNFSGAAGLIRAEILLWDILLHPVNRAGLRRAGLLFKPSLGSLDAIHLVAALDLRPIAAFVTYDKRQAEAAREAGLSVRSPGRENLGR